MLRAAPATKLDRDRADAHRQQPDACEDVGGAHVHEGGDQGDAVQLQGLVGAAVVVGRVPVQGHVDLHALCAGLQAHLRMRTATPCGLQRLMLALLTCMEMAVTMGICKQRMP